jgi:hypothetical protein
LEAVLVPDRSGSLLATRRGKLLLLPRSPEVTPAPVNS